MGASEHFDYDAFLSYSSLDKVRVRKLAERLRSAGVKVWFDDWMVKAGDDVVRVINQGLEASRAMVLCLSPQALASGWVEWEHNAPLFQNPSNSQRSFIPVLLEDCQIPFSVSRYKHVDYREESDEAFQELLRSCRPGSPEPAIPAKQPEAESPGPFVIDLRRLDRVLASVAPGDFVDRQAQVAEISQLVASYQSVCVCGMVGIGKSSVMAKSVREIATRTPAPFARICVHQMVESGTREDRIAQLLRELLIQLDQEIPFSASNTDAAFAHAERLVLRQSVLYAVDNVDGIESIGALLELRKHLIPLTLLITSREATWDPLKPVEIHGLEDDHALVLFRTTFGGSAADATTLLEIVRRRRGHPQVIVQSVKTAIERRLRIDELLDPSYGVTPETTFAQRMRPLFEQLSPSSQSTMLLFGILETPSLGSDFLSRVTGISLAELRRMDTQRLIEVVGSRFRAHDVVRAWSRERVKETSARTLSTIRLRAGRYYVGFLTKRKACSPNELEEIDKERDNILRLIDDLVTPSLVVELCNLMIGDRHDDPCGYVPKRGEMPALLARKAKLTALARKVGGSDSARLEKNLGLFEYWRADHDSAEKLFLRARDGFAGAGDVAGEASCTWLLGYLADDENRYPDALTLYRQGLALAEQTGDAELIATGHHLVGCTLYHQGRFPEADDEFKWARNLIEGLDVPNLHSRIVRRLGYVALGLGQHDEALAILNEVKRECDSLDRRRDSARTARHLGLLYLDQGDLEKAEGQFSEALKVFELQKAQRGKGSTLRCVAALRRVQGSRAEAGGRLEEARERLDEAHKLCAESMEIARKTGSIFGLATGHEELSRILFVQGGPPDHILKHKQSAANTFGTIGHTREAIVREEIAQAGGYRPRLPQPLTVVLFDMMDTLVALSDSAWQRVKEDCAARLGVTPGSYSSSWARTRRKASVGGYGSLELRFRDVARELALGREVSDQEIQEMADEERRLWRTEVRLYPDTMATLTKLRSFGLKQVIVANGSETMKNLPDVLGLTGVIDGFFLSSEVRATKPDPQIYKKALALAGVDAAQCIYLGDGNDRELDGAKALGLFTVRIRRERPPYADPRNQSLDWDIEVASLTELAGIIESLMIGNRDSTVAN